jgi:hypothetical protein
VLSGTLQSWSRGNTILTETIDIVNLEDMLNGDIFLYYLEKCSKSLLFWKSIYV